MKKILILTSSLLFLGGCVKPYEEVRGFVEYKNTIVKSNGNVTGCEFKLVDDEKLYRFYVKSCDNVKKGDEIYFNGNNHDKSTSVINIIKSDNKE